MDLTMPTLDGWEATRLLKADVRSSGIPILALTARATAEDVALGEEAGFRRYLTKPIEPSRVLEEVERVLEIRQPEISVAAGEPIASYTLTEPSRDPHP
jgi:CheY-like chemotaxis protein